MFTYQERFNFVKFLFSIAYSNGKVTQEEELEIRKIASYLYLRKIKIRNSYNRQFLKATSTGIYTNASVFLH